MTTDIKPNNLLTIIDYPGARISRHLSSIPLASYGPTNLDNRLTLKQIIPVNSQCQPICVCFSNVWKSCTCLTDLGVSKLLGFMDSTAALWLYSVVLYRHDPEPVISRS